MSAVIHPEGTGGKTTCRVCCEPNNLLCSRLSSLESAAEQEVDGSSRSHLSSTQSSRYKLVLFNEGLVASMKLLQSVSLQGVPVDIESLSELALIMEFILLYRSELE